MSMLLRASDLAVGWTRTPIAAGITFAVEGGQWWAVTGANGSGKTTLLKTLLGELRPLAGAIEMAPAVATRELLAFVPQQQHLHPALPITIEEFVASGLVGLRLARAPRRARVGSGLARASLAVGTDASFWELSGGERQRAFLARALARDPLLLLLDEPTAGLDRQARDMICAELSGLRRQGMGIWSITHDETVVAQASHELRLGAGTARVVPR